MALIKCKECGNEVSSKAQSCPKCGAVISKPTYKPSGCFVFFIVIVILTIFANITKNKNDESAQTDSTSTISSELPANSPLNKVDDNSGDKKVVSLPNWLSGAFKDEMTDKEEPYVTTTSLNGVAFKFPYHVDGGSKASIVIRRESSKKVAYIYVEKGHMICGYEQCSIQTRSDSGKVQSWSALKGSPGINNVLFIENVTAFENYIRKNNKLRVGIEFYEYGVKSFDFNISGYPGV